MKETSILQALKKLREILSKEDKIKGIFILLMAFGSSFLETITATIIMLFVQVMYQPSVGMKYFSWIDKNVFSLQVTQGRSIFYMSILLGIFYLIKNIFSIFEIYFQNIFVQRMNHRFKNNLLNKYAEIDYGFFLTRNSSLFSEIVNGRVENLFSNGVTSIAITVSEGLTLLFLVGLMFYINSLVATTVFFVGTFFSLIIMKVLLPRFYRIGKSLQEVLVASGQDLLQFFHGFKEIILSSTKDSFVNDFCINSLHQSKLHAKNSTLVTIPRVIIEIVFVLILVIMVGILCKNNEDPIQMTSLIGGYIYAGFRLMPSLNRIIHQISVFKSCIPSIECIHFEITNVASKQSYVHAYDLEFNKFINIKNVSFRYLNTEKDSLHGISLTINKGEYVGIIGETGSGKSTLIDLILGILNPSQGSILIDDRYPTNSYEWHKKIGYVPQNIYLTDNTIESNIAFGEKTINKDLLDKCIKMSQLDDLIKKLPNGIKTLVGERGVRLSGGERQRIAIARALYREPEILIFDEATSALDTKTESNIMITIDSIKRERQTVIMIAHRLSTLRNCDRIISVKNRGIKERNDILKELKQSTY
jgi:ABC-type multidrug transport system fused ATPase/permease subunit